VYTDNWHILHVTYKAKEVLVMSETKKCKHCQTDIPKKAKVCPNCRRKQGGIGKVIGIIVILFVLFGILGSGSDSNENSNTNDNSVSNVSTQKEEVVSTKKLTADKYNSIDFGMSYEDVVGIIGEEGENISEVAIGDIVTTIYQWDEGLTNCNVTIQNDEVTGKAQLGIIDSDVKITMEMYNAVESGMSYAEVVEILGGEGAPLSTSKVLDSVSVIYMWNGKTLGSNCNITFQDGVVFAKAQMGLE